MTGIAIITEETKEDLVKFLKGEDATSAPMGSGGYEIRETSSAGNIAIITFTQCDLAPARTFLAIVDGGTIYGNQIIPDIIKMFVSRLIPFNFQVKSGVKFPPHIVSFLKGRIKV